MHGLYQMHCSGSKQAWLPSSKMTCGSGHNILLCHKSDQDKAFLLETESDITDEELQEIQD